MRRAISPVIATVIIVAVAIAISIAVAGWLMGLWGGFGQTESLKIFPDSYGDSNSDIFWIKIQNVGGSPAQIYLIEVGGKKFQQFYIDLNLDGDDGDQSETNGNARQTVTIDPGSTLAVMINGADQGLDVVAGVAYTVTIYTEAGNVYTTTIYGTTKTAKIGGGSGERG